MALPPSRIRDPRDAPVLRWGILGAGHIAAAMTQALLEGTGQQVVAIGSRDRDRARRFAQSFGVAGFHGSYEDLVADPQVDAVYVATPHSEHRDHALLAIAAGKHVLVEKAFTRNAREAAEVLTAAEAAGVTCVEAMWSRFLPGYDVVRRAVEEGVLGDVRVVQADHGQLLYPDGPARLAAPELAGGALLDLGVYPVHLAAMLLPRIEAVRAVGTLTPLGVDEHESIALHGADGAVAALTACMSATTATVATIAGTRARLDLAGPFYQPTAIRLTDPAGEVLEVWEPEVHEAHLGLRYEAVELARCVADGRRESPLLPWDETRRVMALMDEVRAQLGVLLPGE
ncbi:gfo/Idh/MocA family oxidoreductase [Aeromicrobium sp. 636]|uniref:Gfo/Idh/MocA family oxidoreductase n=1 Tax=Aeromicrobium senzhongii TaxID=2663859 RepID=A0A8I0K310_9ACTN|nr:MULTISPECIES: Gfo/Idh/MocA family oxidoreductase [Aeromicrobium]MBC9226615.1 Gfo/Idh/MocA family oxidoreductase [Aeromicrobium senzhongii]MCQ3998716.1 gfo/Idh/MocA family oxidoreductase [Aeromicrobium sp. 636]MTB89143.1 gfo/Idh/MocA family oxidoreductase [Aeromicrobium senzhongii]QNL93589.1 Gfo/Idh/MocA family oxidoreductase [Aeromicrobium senzhongii]